jgi:hypothetical protein
MVTMMIIMKHLMVTIMITVKQMMDDIDGSCDEGDDGVDAVLSFGN